MGHDNVAMAFLLTLLAGLSTGIGGLVVLFMKGTNKKILSVSLGFSAGVMIYISFVEILQEARIHLNSSFGPKQGELVTIVAFFAGMAFVALLDQFLPEFDDCPHSDMDCRPPKYTAKYNSTKLLKTGLLTALAVTIHNFPEGIATFISSVKNPALGTALAIAIAIHNIPEGISIAVPVYCATENKKKALLLSLLSGLTEPLGALIGYLVLMPFLSDALFGISFAVIAGIMIFISFHELLPSSREYGEQHLSLYGLIGGMATMAISLVFIS